MGHSQSRQQRGAQSERTVENGGQDQSRSSSHTPSPQSPDDGSNTRSGVAVRRKRRRDSTSPVPLTDSASAERPLSQRQRTSLDVRRPASSSTASNAPISSESHHSSMEATPHAMDIESADPQPLSPPTEPSTTNYTHVQSGQSDLQQRYAAVQSTDDASAGVHSGATPPPHLDALREERERARRQILETLGSIAPAAAPAPASSTSASATRSPSSTSAPMPAPASTPHPLASATIAALLGAMASGRAASQTASPRSSLPASDNAASALNSASQPSAQQQQRPQPTRAHAIRVPLHPEMINGTSMVVQGALVARTIPNPPAPSTIPSPPESSQTGTHQANAREPRPTATISDSSGSVSAGTGSGNSSAASGATLEGDNSRGAVTLEEQAVMLSRILGIAAAATAASLLNTSESHHVDPSLLQTSLRRPFERMSQAPNDRNARWLADWQLRPHSTATQANPSSASGLGHGLRGRLAALSRRVQSASSSSEPPSPQGNSLASSTSDASGRREIPPAAETGTDAENSNTAEGDASRQQEIIAHLLNAAEREAASQRLRRTRTAEQPSTSTASVEAARARSSSFSSQQRQNSASQQEAPRASLSRLVRSTLGTFMHPSRLLPTRNLRPEGTQLSDAPQEGWSSGSTHADTPGAARASSSDFSLGPNDVAGTLRQVRNGILPDGVPGSFGSFLNHLVRDLMAAVQLMQPSSEVPLERAEAQTTHYFEHVAQGEATSGAEVLDGDATESGEAATPTRDRDTSQAQNQQAEATGLNNEARGPEQTRVEEVDVETQARRDRDFQNGNLSFFRLFRFDPVAPSQLVPCIVVGVRSLNVTERFGQDMAGARAPGPGREFGGSRQQTSRPTTLGSATPTSPLRRQRAQSEGLQASAASGGDAADENGEELPASRFMLFVSGGRYPPNHPLLTSNPATAGRDLMILMDLLSTMQAMQHKPSTVTQQEIDASDLAKIKGSEVGSMAREGKITENMAERCLVCLEDWKDDDDCRVLACRHAFHTTCVDRWMTSSSNTCPLCRRQGVAKDGRRAGEDTADSRRAAQA